MLKTGIAVMTVLMFGALLLCNGSVSAQPGQTAVSGPGKMMHSQPEKRLMRMSKSLDLTEEQKAKIKPILDEEVVKVKAILEDSSLNRDQKRDKIRQLHVATYELIKPVLTQEQQKKHEDMRASAKGWHKKGHPATPADRLDRMSRILNLTEEQKAQIKPVLEEESVKIKALHSDTALNRQQKRDNMREIRQSTFDKIKPLLTEEQLKKHADMPGKRKSVPKQGETITQP